MRLISLMILAGGTLFAQVGLTVSIAPPELPAYEQPICPGDGYIWTPGYWAWDNDYYWVPGTWVMAPEPGYLWTPGYWGWGDGGYFFNAGYWGTTIGFYGGINYGFGYFGHGYDGGRWDNGHFFYNTAINHVDTNRIHNVYNTRVNETTNRVSYNGGKGGIGERANAQEEAAGRERHIGATSAQTQHAYSARNDPQQRVAANHGSPTVAATARPNMANHPKELPPVERAAAPKTGNAKLDQRYQKQQDQTAARQTQQRQTLQNRQESQHQQLTRQNAAPARTQHVEQQHQQQTQHLQQRQTQQTHQMQQRQAPAGGGQPGGRRK